MEYLVPKKKKNDKMIYGFIVGLIGPIFGLFLYYLLLFSNKYDLSRVLEMLMENTNLQSPMLSVALLFNLVLLYISFKFDYVEIGRGLIAGTFMYVPIILIMKYI